jgi:DNA-binding NtrC family response regulator
VNDVPGPVLVVDDEHDMAESCAFFLRRAGYAARTASSGDEALRLLERQQFSLVVTDVRMPRMSGLLLLDAIKARDPDIEVVMITGYPEVETAIEAIRRGALDYITKPFTEETLMERVEKALAHRQLKEQNTAFKERLRRGTAGRRLIYRSPAFAATVTTLERAARTDASVLIQGESGTGKELLAHHLHDSSARAERPFVPVDCTTMPESLVESELFGHVKGAFSGATGNKMGLFQVADGGTLFLDEVGELALSFQTKLLRAIQERQFRRVGGTEQIAVDVRIVCATNRNLVREVERGRFREDLFYRLDVVRIEVPPLRERVADIELLARFFLEQFVAGNQASRVRDISPAALDAMRAYAWPGNVRQLRNAIERACALGNARALEPTDLPAEVLAAEIETEEAPAAPAAMGSFQEMKARKVAAIESTYLETLLRRNRGNVTRSAEEAGMARSAFQKLMQRYGIKSSDFRDGS